MKTEFETAAFDGLDDGLDVGEDAHERCQIALSAAALRLLKNLVVFDIETGPLPEERLRASLPPFDAAEVKCGNLKDPEKIAAKIAEAKASYETDFFERAALRAETGRVVAIGLGRCDDLDGHLVHYIEGVAPGGELPDEKTLLEWFWEVFVEYVETDCCFCGFNIVGFDVPFLLRRSWLNGVTVPRNVFAPGGRYLNSAAFVDLLHVWQAGDRQNFISLDRLSQFLDIGQKNGNGADFHKLWETDHLAAREYLTNDLAMTMRCAARLLNFA